MPKDPAFDLSKLKIVTKDPYKRYHSLRQMKEFINENNMNRESIYYRVLNQHKYFNTEPRSNQEVLKYMLKGKKVGKNKFFFVFACLAGFSLNMLACVAYSEEILLRDPTEAIVYCAPFQYFLRKVSYAIFSKFTGVLWFNEIEEERPGVPNLQTDFVSTKLNEDYLLNLQIEHYLKNKDGTFDFLEMGEESTYELI